MHTFQLPPGVLVDHAMQVAPLVASSGAISHEKTSVDPEEFVL